MQFDILKHKKVFFKNIVKKSKVNNTKFITI